MLAGLALAFALVPLSAAVPAQADAKKKALELKLSANVTTLCLGTAIDLELELKNAGKRPVEIDRVDLWASFTYSYHEPGGAGNGGGMGTGCDHCRGNVVTLIPGEMHWTAHKFSLDGEFFRRAGKYEISTSVASNSSNRVEFELIECGQGNF
jgi:hypothetical protein